MAISKINGPSGRVLPTQKQNTNGDVGKKNSHKTGNRNRNGTPNSCNQVYGFTCANNTTGIKRNESYLEM